MLHICLMVGPLEWEINFKNLYWLERQLYVGHCGQAEIIWCLKILRLKLICKFCTEERIVYEEQAKEIMDACRALELTVIQIFAAHGWRFCNRITAS
jgi:hypothetical protein